MDSSPPGFGASEGASGGDPASPPVEHPAAPPVVAVVVAHEPGDWFNAALDSLRVQDYPNLSVLVIDAASTTPIAPRVADVLPDAYVRRLEDNPGFGAAANEVLDVVEGAAFYLFCHDDVALAPDVVRSLVEEAFRSNAGVVGPKLVSWDDDRRLLQVGEGADKTGVTRPLVERGELDQEQHDAVRDVFLVPGAATLVRADLFAAIGGFDEGIDFLHDDLSLCWRSHVAGARVLVNPAARVRHLEALGLRRPVDDRRRLQARHRLRTLLTCYGRFHLLRVLPQAALFALVEVLYSLVVGRTRQARDIAGAWSWNLRRLSDVRAARAEVRRFRRVPDSEVRRFQMRGSGRLSMFLRGQIGRGEDRLSAAARASRDLGQSLRTVAVRTAIAVWAVVLLVMVVGTRHLTSQRVPAVGQMVLFGDGPGTLLAEWLSGWRSAGLGSEAPAPTGIGLLGLLGGVTLGSMGFLRQVLILGLLPLGAIGAYRLPAPTGSRRAQLVALVVYVAVPVPYAALANGRWSALAVYAAAPFLLGRLARASGLAPFGATDGDPGASVPVHPTRRHALAIGVITALVATIAPVAVAVVLLMALAFCLGSALVFQAAGSGRTLAAALGGAVVAMVLHLPWALDFLVPGTAWSVFAGVERPEGGPGIDELLRFETGPLGAAPIGYAFLATAALALLMGRDWRLGFAVRGWTIAAVCWGVVWAGHQGLVPFGLPPDEILLAPAAAGLALASGLGMVAFEIDLPGYRFGWRQALSALALLALIAGTLPVLGGSLDGRWGMPTGDFSRTLGRLDDEQADGPFRVLWLGDPDVLPLAGWDLGGGLAYATSDGLPGAQELWAGSDDGSTRLLADALTLAQSRQTARLGRLLAPMGVKYVVVPERLAPSPFEADVQPVPPDLKAVLAAQLDLKQLDLDEAVTVYRNEAAISTRAAVPPGTGDGVSLGDTVRLDLHGAPAVLLRERGYQSFSGDLDAGSRVLLSASSSSGWRLRVDGRTAPRSKVFAWANAFDATEGGSATLRYRTPPLRYAFLALQVLLWVLALGTLLRMRLGPRRGGS